MSNGVKVKGLRCDNAGELKSEDFQNYCKTHGIMQTFTGPYSPQQLGLAERANRTIFEMTRCLLKQSGLSKQLWAETTAVYIINRLPSEGLNGASPYYQLFSKEAKLNHLRIFGCTAYVHTHDRQRRKLDDKAWKGILVGYDPHNRRCYRVLDLDNRIVKRTVHVTFNEHEFPGKLKIEDFSAAEDDNFIVFQDAIVEGASTTSEPAQDTNIQDAMKLLPRNTNLLPNTEVNDQDNQHPPAQDIQVPRVRDFKWCKSE